MMKNEEYTLKPFDLEKYAKALNELIGMDVAYFQGDPHVDAMVECIVTAKKYEKKIRELETKVGELKAELKEAEEEYDRVYEQAEADIRGNMADGGTSCHWCIAGHTADAVNRFANYLKEYSFNCDPGNGHSFDAIDADELDSYVKEFLEERRK
jgi:hypothetical protein